jgi:hypothetical protein
MRIYRGILITFFLLIFTACSIKITGTIGTDEVDLDIRLPTRVPTETPSETAVPSPTPTVTATATLIPSETPIPTATEVFSSPTPEVTVIPTTVVPTQPPNVYQCPVTVINADHLRLRDAPGGSVTVGWLPRGYVGIAELRVNDGENIWLQIRGEGIQGWSAHTFNGINYLDPDYLVDDCDLLMFGVTPDDRDGDGVPDIIDQCPDNVLTDTG